MKTCGFCKEPCGNEWCPVYEEQGRRQHGKFIYNVLRIIKWYRS